MPSKMHNEFSFDKEIYIDRFVAKNASRFPDFMNTLDKLKAKKQALEEALKKYQHQGKDFFESISFVRKFIETQKAVDEEDKDSQVPDENDMVLHDPTNIGCLTMKKSDLSSTIKCLKMYEDYLSSNMESLKKELSETNNNLGNAYTCLKEYPYYLHAIVIHEGEDNSGHYYSFIKNHIENEWYKYDDHRVTRVEEEQVLGEAYGITKLKTSAYMVMYVSKSALQYDKTFKTEFDYYMSLVPKELLSEVNQDNYKFNEELQEAKNKELANEIMEQFKKLDAQLKKKVAGVSDKGLVSFAIFLFKCQELML